MDEVSQKEQVTQKYLRLSENVLNYRLLIVLNGMTVLGGLHLCRISQTLQEFD